MTAGILKGSAHQQKHIAVTVTKIAKIRAPFPISELAIATFG